MQNEDQISESAAAATGRWGGRHWAWLAALAVLYIIFTVSQWSLGYIDFGDGNYMYIGTQIARGEAVYKDILAPQPPCHLYLGAAVAWTAQRLGMAQPLYLFRVVSLLIHLASLGLVVLLALRAWGRPRTALLAGAIYLWLPIGFWWSSAWQSEPLEMLFLLLMICASLRGSVASDVAAGLFAALAGLTNATAAPFLLVLIIYTAIRAPRRAAVMTGACVALAGAVVAFLQVRTQGAFLDNVVFNQVGTYPKDGFLAYAWGKLIGQGGKVLALEGGFLFVAMLGLARYLKSSPLPSFARFGVGWFFVATLGSLVYVTKGGTMDYIFSLSEPAVAVLAAGELTAWGRRLKKALARERGAALVLKLALLPVAMGFALGPAVNFYALLWRQAAYEAPEGLTLTVRRRLTDYSQPGQPVLAPPFYAFLADRPLWGHYSELFIWNMNYWNDRRENNQDGPGWTKVRQMEAVLLAQEVPIVILEMDQTGTIPEVMTALMRRYEPQQTRLIRTTNTNLGVFVASKDLTSAARGEKWRGFLASMQDQWGAKTFNDRFGHWARGLEACLGESQP